MGNRAVGATALVTACLLAGCSDPPTTPGQDDIAYLTVHSIEVVVASEARPAVVTANVVGLVPDVCTKVGSVTANRDGNVVTLTIFTTRPEGPCVLLVPPPVRETFRLPGVFPVGSYVLQVNGQELSFTV